MDMGPTIGVRDDECLADSMYRWRFVLQLLQDSNIVYSGSMDSPMENMESKSGTNLVIYVLLRLRQLHGFLKEILLLLF